MCSNNKNSKAPPVPPRIHPLHLKRNTICHQNPSDDFVYVEELAIYNKSCNGEKPTSSSAPQLFNDYTPTPSLSSSGRVQSGRVQRPVSVCLPSVSGTVVHKEDPPVPLPMKIRKETVGRKSFRWLLKVRLAVIPCIPYKKEEEPCSVQYEFL